MSDDKTWWRDARFGMMIHWGLYSRLGGIYHGKKMDYIGEWIGSRFRIPESEYSQLAQDWDPKRFDAKAWVKKAKEAGMGYLIFTAKHHEGFAMYHSYVDPYNIYDATPFHRDPLKELADACHEEGIRLGIYYSQALDWHEKDGGGFAAGATNFGMSWTNDWDYPDNAQKHFDDYFRKKALPQVQELCQRYGEISLFWFDTPLSINEEETSELYDVVKRYQPHCLINSRIGFAHGDYDSLGDNMIPEALPAGDYEVAATMNDTWGYKSFDHHYKDSSAIIRLLSLLSARGVNYLLNVGPDGDGAFPPEGERILADLGKWMGVNHAAIVGSHPVPLALADPHFALTESGRNLYAMLFQHPQTLTLDGVLSKARGARSLSGKSIPLTQKGNRLVLDLASLKKEKEPVVAILFEEAPRFRRGAFEQGGQLFLRAADAVVEGTETASQNEKMPYQSDGTQLALGKPVLSLNGAFASYFSPAYSLRWTFALDEDGDFSVAALTSALYHSHPWLGGHRLRLEVQGKTLESTLALDKDVTDPSSPYYPLGESKLGVLSLRQGSRITLRLFPEKILNNDGIGLALSSLLLTRLPKKED